MSSSKKKNKEPLASDEEKEEEEEGSLVKKKPQVRRQVILDDEPSIPQKKPSGSVPFHLIDEPEDVPIVISEEEVAEPTIDPPSIPVENLSAQGFEGDKDFGFISEEPSLATLPMSLIAPAAISQGKAGPSTKGEIK